MPTELRWCPVGSCWRSHFLSRRQSAKMAANHTCANVPYHKILYQTKNTQHHTILALGFTKAYIYAMPHTTIPISLYIIKGFRNYQPLVTTISQDSCAYLQLTTLILVQCTQSKHRVAEGAISHRFRLRLVVAVWRIANLLQGSSAPVYSQYISNIFILYFQYIRTIFQIDSHYISNTFHIDLSW